MRQNSRVRIGFETLEDRVVPSVTAKVVEGSLFVTGAATNPGDLIGITLIDKGVARVSDGATLVGEFEFSKNVGVRLGEANDKVRIDLGGFGVPGRLAVGLGAGENGLEVVNGRVGRGVLVVGGKGADRVGFARVGTEGPVEVAVDGGKDAVAFGKGFAAGKVSVTGAEAVSLAREAKAGDLSVLSGRAGGTDVTVAGLVRRNLVVTTSIDLRTSLDILGNVGGSVLFRGGGGADLVRIGEAAVVGKAAVLSLGGGSDSVEVFGSIGKGGDSKVPALVIEAGAGNDKVAVGASAKVGGPAVVFMGVGDDTFAVREGAKLGRTFVDGGRGKDTFIGDPARPGLKAVNFEVFVP